MTNKSFRNTMGLASLSALALVMVACGGSSSSSTPAPVTNQAPSTPVIVGPTSAITQHPAFYNLSATDPEGDAITYLVNGTAIAGNTYQLNASTAGSSVLTVVARDSKGASSSAATLTVAVAANRAPQFISAATAQLTGASNTIAMGYTVAAQDPDADDVQFSITGTPSYTNVTGGAVSINSTTGVVSFTGTVATGQTAGTVQFTVTAVDKLPGTTTILSGSATQTVTMTYFSGNTPPVIQTTSLPSVPQNHGLLAPGFQLQASDAQQTSSTLAWSLVSGSTGIAVSGTGAVTWTSGFASGSDFTPRTLTVRVTDAGGLTDTKTFNIPVIADEKPNFATQTYTETVGGVQFFDPSRLRANITSRLRFTWLDTEATDAEFFSDSTNALKGWRAATVATDAENDAVQYSIKSNSVFRHGVPHTDTTATNYPGIDANTGEIKWTPNRQRYNTGATGVDNSLALTLAHDYVPNVAATGDSLQNRLDAANWSFTVVGQQLIGGVATPGQSNETTLTIKVQPNDRPFQGPADKIWADTLGNLTTLSNGVRIGGGSAVAGVGRPSIQEPVASDTSTPGTASKWIWVVGTPGGANFPLTTTRDDYGLFDPNTNAIDGHQDAIKIDFGYRVATSDYLVNGALTGLISGTHYPTLDTTGNLPAVITASSLANGFYNPWISGTAASLGNMVVGWAPVRIQYTLGRYIGQSAYKFGLVSEDQYGRMNKGEKSIFPIFGTLRFFNSRFIGLTDVGSGSSLRGSLTATGNTETRYAAVTAFNYVMQYLPYGVSSGAGNAEWIDAGTTETYGANLFGNSTGVGAPASGTQNAAGTQATAGGWHALDGLNAGRTAGYPANPVNTLMDPAARAAAVPGTAAGLSQTYTQFRGGAADGTGGDPVQVTVSVSGAYSDNEAMGRVVPSNSPYLYALANAVSPTNAANGLTAARIKEFWLEGNPLNVSNVPRWYSGKPQSEVNYQRIYPGRSVWYSNSAEAVPALTVDNLATTATPVTGGRLRLSYTWPTIITNTATGYPAAGTANLFDESDVIQVATPNLSGNARFFFTGNRPAAAMVVGTPAPAASETTATNYFGKLGYTVPPTTWTAAGASVSLAPHQPIAAVTNSLWVPNNADLKFNFPNAYSTPAGGSGYTDIPFTGVRGFIDRAIATGYDFDTLGTNENIYNRPGHLNWLSVAHNTAGNVSLTLSTLDSNANPALLATASGDRTFHVWMKAGNNRSGGAIYSNAYGAWAGSMVTGGASSITAKGGITTVPDYAMANGSLTDTQAQVSFAELNGQLGAANMAQAGTLGVAAAGWNRNEFELLRNIVSAPSQFGLAARANLVDPAVNGARVLTRAAFEAGNTKDGLTQNSLVVYAVKDRGTKTTQNGATYSNVLGQAGLEPGSPVLAQWWNTGNGDVTLANFPSVIKAYANQFIPTGFTEVVEINHNYVSELIYPAGVNAWKVYGQIGLIAPNGHTLMSQTQGVKPVVTPVRQLAINDLKINTATGTTVIGTKLDIFNGNAETLATGAPAAGSPSYKLANGNATADYRLNGYSNIQLSWQPAVNDLRHPSGYIVTLYKVVDDSPFVSVQGEWRTGHIGGIGAIQTLNLPPFQTMDILGHATPSNMVFAVKVRNVWMEGTEGAAGHSFDMGKEPWATRFPMAYADMVSGVFVVAF